MTDEPCKRKPETAITKLDPLLRPQFHPRQLDTGKPDRFFTNRSASMQNLGWWASLEQLNIFVGVRNPFTVSN